MTGARLAMVVLSAAAAVLATVLLAELRLGGRLPLPSVEPHPAADLPEIPSWEVPVPPMSKYAEIIERPSGQLDGNNAEQVNAKVVLELANAPTTPDADRILFERSIMLIPDVLANAGGVVGSYFEWIQNLSNDYWPEEKVLDRLKETMITAFNDIHTLYKEEKSTMRKAAYTIAVKRILRAERLRGNI